MSHSLICPIFPWHLAEGTFFNVWWERWHVLDWEEVGSRGSRGATEKKGLGLAGYLNEAEDWAWLFLLFWWRRLGAQNVLHLPVIVVFFIRVIVLYMEVEGAVTFGDSAGFCGWGGAIRWDRPDFRDFPPVEVLTVVFIFFSHRATNEGFRFYLRHWLRDCVGGGIR